jgi:hypothetical protein
VFEYQGITFGISSHASIWEKSVEAMEDLVVEIKSMTTMFAAMMAAIKLPVEDSQSIIKELVAWKPHVDGAMQEV